VGKRILDMAQKDGSIFMEEIIRDSFVDFNLSMMKKKRKMAFFRMERSQGKKILVPNYNTTLIMNYKERFNETLSSLPFFFGKTNFTRKLALRIALSPLGSLVKKVSDILKLKKSH